MTYLQNRNGIYRVRRRVPQHLKQVIGRGEFLTQSLGTGNLAEANRLAIPILAEFTRIIDLAEKNEWPPLDPGIVPEWYFWWLSSREKPPIDESVRQYIRENNILLPPNNVTRLIRDCQSYKYERAVRSDAVSNLLERMDEEDIDPQQISLPDLATQENRYVFVRL